MWSQDRTLALLLLAATLALPGSAYGGVCPTPASGEWPVFGCEGGEDARSGHHSGGSGHGGSDSGIGGEGEGGSFNLAQALNRLAGGRSTSAADAATKLSDGEHGISEYDKALAEDMNKNINTAKSTAAPLLASTDPDTRAKGNAYLDSPANPNEKYQDVYKNLGLQSNRDVLKNAPEYVDNLQSAAEDRQKQSDFLAEQAKQARAAAAKMNEFANTSGQRNSNLDSLGTDSAAKYPGGDAKSGAGNGTGGASSLTVAGDGKDGVSKTQKFSSLSEKLKAKLEAEADEKAKASSLTAKTDGTDRAPASTLAGFLDSALEDGKGGGEGASGSGTDGSAGQTISGRSGNGNFSLSGSDTDREVNRLLGKFDNLSGAAASNANIFGSADQTIFARVTKFLVKAQKENKVRTH